MNRTLFSTALLVVLTGALSQGQSPPVRVTFDSGHVTLTATEALITDVLTEWARVGGTVITGVEWLPATRVTLNLEGVSERTALDAVIGSAAGYVSAVRTDAPAGRSLLRSLQIVLPSKTAPAKATRVIDMSIPESKYEYSAPEFDPETLMANPETARPVPPAPTEPYVMPEMRFQYTDPTPEPPAEPEGKPEGKPDGKTDQKAKKPPSGF